MVAPTRTPQARGVKCDICKKILTLATWLDQTKLAKSVEDPQLVLELFNEHDKTDCPCIPKNIENLLVGSTYFELHRLTLKDLDFQIHTKQCDTFKDLNRKNLAESRNGHATINDCYDTNKGSRFKIYSTCFDSEQCKKANIQLSHLKTTIDHWTTAMMDQANPFNSKLALRLGLTHHVVYACYYFKYHRILDYQLKTAVLLLNVFKSIDGITANAILHANYLLIRALMDCSQYKLARHHLKQAEKLSPYKEKSYYESILLSCVASELRLLDEKKLDKRKLHENKLDKSCILEELAKLAEIQQDDKLQHYYARTLAVVTIIRFVCAIIRRCFETSFELVLSDKHSGRQQSDSNQTQILDHNWIKFAVCDFSFTSFNLLKNFYIRAGMPECLELLFNGLSLVSYRTGCLYWQSRLYSMGIEFDFLCDKLGDAQTKLDSMARISSYTKEPVMIDWLRLESEVCLLTYMSRDKGSIMKVDILDLLDRMKKWRSSQLKLIREVKIYECKTNSDMTIELLKDTDLESALSVGDPALLESILITLRAGITSMLKLDIASKDARDLVKEVNNQIDSRNSGTLEFYTCQLILEILLQLIGIDTSEQQLLNAISSSKFFLSTTDDCFSSLSSKLSKLQLTDDRTSSAAVSMKSDKRLLSAIQSLTQNLDPMETSRNLTKRSREDILLLYLKLSDPNPDYLLYRRVHELMLCLQLDKEEPHQHQDRILYHFTESITANTMRYRWMMYEEQQVAPFDPTSTKSQTKKEPLCNIKLHYMSFSNSLTHPEEVIRSIPDDFRMCQLKYILDERSESEHLVIMCFDNRELVGIHAKRAIVPDELFGDATADNMRASLIPNRFEIKIEESRKSLFSTARLRSELRKKLETDISIILHDLENEWLGPFRFILCAKINETNYQRMISKLIDTINKSIDAQPSNLMALKMLLEGAPLLSRKEFCQVISMLYNPNDTCLCYNLWLKSIEKYIDEFEPNTNKMALLKKLPKGQVGLILDKPLERLPIESLPAVLSISQGMFRVPSLRLMFVLASRCRLPIRINPDQVSYVLDPADNLSKTRERFDKKLSSGDRWLGVVGRAPKSESLEVWLSQQELYIFIGHGAGTVYYNKLCNGKGLSALKHIKSAAIVMGCSSGRMIAEGPMLESFGIGWAFIFRGSPCYMGLLWDVTDTDIDKFLDSLMSKWMPLWSPVGTQQIQAGGDRPNHSVTCPYITDASSVSRHVCQLQLLVGSAPVVYGLPISCRSQGSVS